MAGHRIADAPMPVDPSASEPAHQVSAGWRQRAGSAALWIGLGFAVTQAIRLGSSIVLTRLLAPEMYGLMALGTVIIAAVVMLSDFGFSQSVIHNPRADDPAFLDTIWSMQLLRGLALCAIMNGMALGLLAAARWSVDTLAGSYADPRLPGVIAILSLVPVAMGLESTNLARAQRMLALGRVVRNEVLVQLGVTALMIALARHWATWWVLPVGWLVQALAVSLLSHLTLPGPPNRPRWEPAAARAAWHFSKWILLSSALTYLFREGDRIVLGGLLTPAELGIYATGALLVNALREVIYRLAAYVGMPALAEVARHQPARLAHAYRQCRLPVDTVCLLASGFLLACADRLIGIIYDGRYAAAGQVLAALSLGLVALRYSVTEQYLIATGETRQLYKRGLIQNLTLYIAVPGGFSLWGLPGALGGVVLAQTSFVPVMLHMQHQRGLLDWRFELGVLGLFPLGWAAGWLLR